MRIFLSFLLLVQFTVGQEIDNQSYNPCEDPLLKLARVKGIKAVPLKDIRKFRKALRKCKVSQKDGEKKVSEIFEADWKRDYKSAMIFSSWTSTYSILVFMTLVYYYIGMIYATEPGDPEYD